MSDPPRPGEGWQRFERLQAAEQRLSHESSPTAVLELLRQAPRSRADLAVATGLNKATISKLIERLLDDGLVRETGSGSSGPGRPAAKLEINPSAGYIIGAELGVDFLNVILTDFAAQPLASAQTNVIAEHGSSLAVASLQRLVRKVTNDAGVRESEVLGLGLSVCGLVDIENGSIVYSPNHDWSDVPVRQDLARVYRFPVFIENDARISALAEERFGVARGESEFVVVTGSAGIGVGVVSGGRLIRGKSGWAGEFGHMTVEPDGPRCRCGNRGCWETLASERALLGRLRMPAGSVDAGRVSDQPLSERWHRARGIAAAAAQGGRAESEALAETGRYLGIGVATIINALNPSLVVIGGGLGLAADQLLPHVEAVVSERALSGSRRACRIEPAAHGLDSCALGGVALTLNELSRPSYLAPRN